jgi:predicted O-methyltransferase YrrM
MQYGKAAPTLRNQAKRLVRTRGFQWLSKPTQVAWYYWRTIRELFNVPAVLASFSWGIRDKSTEELVEYVFSSFGGLFRPFQNRLEIARLVERVRELKPERVIEIGTARGGTLFLLSCAASQTATLVSIDLPAGPFGGGYPAWKGRLYRRLMGRKQRLVLIRGNSHDNRILEQALDAMGDKPVDLLFIDGDHSYGGAKTDFLRYSRHMREGGLIVFHDIIETPHDKAINVAPLWAELASRYETSEIVESYDQGGFGIGVVVAPHRWRDQDPIVEPQPA